MIDAAAAPTERLTVGDVLGPYADHADATDTVCENLIELVRRANLVLDAMVADGCTPLRNPRNKTFVSGSANGGFRPQDCPMGAPRSKHKLGLAVDLVDPYRELAKWAVNNLGTLAEIGLWIEDPRWTPTWLHLQCVAPGNPPVETRRVFIPDSSPPKAPALPGQRIA